MFFWKISEGGGVIFDPKNYIADFVGFKAVYFGCKFWKKCPKRGVVASPKNFIANLRILSGFSGKKRNVISKNREGGGGQGRLGVFQKNIHFGGSSHPLDGSLL